MIQPRAERKWYDVDRSLNLSSRRSWEAVRLKLVSGTADWRNNSGALQLAAPHRIRRGASVLGAAIGHHVHVSHVIR
jgi:hypothetical protein